MATTAAAARANPLRKRIRTRLWPCCKHCPNGPNDPHEPLPEPTHLDPCAYCGHKDLDAVEVEREED